MKYVKQFGIILAISFIGELAHYLIPLPVPASIYGLVLMLVLLGSKALKVEDVKDTATFLIEIMPMMFIPAAVGLMNSWDMIQSRIIPYTITTIVSLVCVMLVSGRVTQWIIKKERKS
ncbi:MAG: CidA/LrgA family protein [Agathobacter sp.]|nr:CidA/LrgA family protein [Agathobacter sp.]